MATVAPAITLPAGALMVPEILTPTLAHTAGVFRIAAIEMTNAILIAAPMALLNMIFLLVVPAVDGQQHLLDSDGNVDAGLVLPRSISCSACDYDRVGALRRSRIRFCR